MEKKKSAGGFTTSFLKRELSFSSSQSHR
ncbi:hypothetical protein V9T40_006949 [Parthenolecanium corni]|uniref:Uncharacterized protein n=1 Tax=Parthenolecanium corni TaxID=536013 RepID=A0AAN9YAB9_9HEMI